MHEVVVAGDDVRLVLRVTGYEYPSLESGPDANWLTDDVELTSDAGGSFRGAHGVSFRTDELTAFRDAVRRLVNELDGEATLTHLEDEVGCTVRLTRGVGDLTAFVRWHVPTVELSVAHVRTDQSYLQETLRQLDELVSAFPVRGDT